MLRHNHQLDHYGETAATKLIKSEPSESALAAAAAAAVVAAAVDGTRELAEAKTAGVGRTAVGSASTSVTAASADSTIDSVLHGVSSTAMSSSSSLNEVISRHRHHHHQQQPTAETQQTNGGCSFTVSSLVHPTTGSSSAGTGGGFASVVDGGLGRDVSVDGVLNNVDPVGGVADGDSSCFDPSTAAAAAVQWFAAAGGHHQGTQYGTGYSSRCTPEFYMQRLHASIAADRRHSVAAAACIGLGDADGTVPLSTSAFGHHPASDGYSATAAWYGASQSSDVVCSPTAGSGAYVAGLHDMFDVSAASRMLSTRQSCAQLQTASPFRAYYGTGGTVITPAPAAYAGYADDCAGGKY